MLDCNTVNIKRVTGFDSYGEPVVAKTEPIRCKIEFSNKKVVGRNGNEVVSTGTIRTNTYIGDLDLIKIGGDYRDFIQIQPQTDFVGKTVYWIGWF